jgi:hypothetical protein
MDSGMKGRINEIRSIENKYGLMLFGMGLSYLADVGHRNLDAANVEEGIRQIVASGEADKANGITPVMSSECQCEILRCAAELSKYSIWTLFGYIKKHMEIGGIDDV